MFESVGLTVLLAAAGGAVAGNLLSFVAKRIDNLVRKTDTKLDDKIWEAVRGAMDNTFEVWTTFGDEEAKKAEDLSSGH